MIESSEKGGNWLKATQQDDQPSILAFLSRTWGSEDLPMGEQSHLLCLGPAGLPHFRHLIGLELRDELDQ